MFIVSKNKIIIINMENPQKSITLEEAMHKHFYQYLGSELTEDEYNSGKIPFVYWEEGDKSCWCK